MFCENNNSVLLPLHSKMQDHSLPWSGQGEVTPVLLICLHIQFVISSEQRNLCITPDYLYPDVYIEAHWGWLCTHYHYSTIHPPTHTLLTKSHNYLNYVELAKKLFQTWNRKLIVCTKFHQESLILDGITSTGENASTAGELATITHTTVTHTLTWFLVHSRWLLRIILLQEVADTAISGRLGVGSRARGDVGTAGDLAVELSIVSVVAADWLLGVFTGRWKRAHLIVEFPTFQLQGYAS